MKIKKITAITQTIIGLGIFVWIIMGFDSWDYFDSFLNEFKPKIFESIEETTCSDLQEYTIGKKIYNGKDTWKINDIRNSNEEYREANGLICIGELISDDISGIKLRMELSNTGGKQWYDYRVIDKNILEQFADEM
jgi:hypothetical protein